MKNANLKQFKPIPTWLYVTLLVGITTSTFLVSGCRQPVTNTGSNRSALFDFSRSPRWLGGSGSQSGSGIGSQFANNVRQGLGGNGFGNSIGGGSFGAGGLGGLAGNNGGGINRGGGFNGGGNGATGNGMPGDQQYAAITGQFQNLNQRLSAYDSDNQLLNTEVASLQQKLQLANQYNQTLKTQLADTSGRIQQSEMEKQAAIQQLASAQMQIAQANAQGSQIAQGRGQNQGQGFGSNQTQGQLSNFGGNSAPTQFAGGATIRANNSLMQGFSNIQIPGGQARMDGDVVRIEFPSDRMFVPGTYQIQPAQLSVMQNIVGTLRQSFPKQIVGIEAHWDNTPLNPPTTTHHQLTATQALAVFDKLVQLGLPKNQMFTMAMASNRPRHPQGSVGGVNPNRRIELVIYPETYDGSY